jgi:hypothetical protein
MKKLFILMAVIGAVAFAGSAVAAEYNINIYGASAQHKFWLNLAPDFLAAAAGGACGTVNQSSHDKKHGIARGLNCTFNGGNDTIYIRYSSRASYDGVNAINEALGGTRDMVDETTCAWGGPKDDSCALAPKAVNLGASDVAWDSFVQSTTGWEDGNQSFPGPLYSAPSASVVFPDSEPPNFWRPVIVPFAFYVNNKVCKARCVSPTPSTGAHDVAGADLNNLTNTAGPLDQAGYMAEEHKSYGKWGWQCDYRKTAANGGNPDCVGYYKCIDGTCNGGINANGVCTTAADCPDVALEDTRCEFMPLDNITQTMARLIFSGQVSDWRFFYPYIKRCDKEFTEAQPILKCMRHAGSGTHATMDLGVMRGVVLQGQSVPNVTWHFTSSTDLMKCVIDFDGAIGYADADKLIDTKDAGPQGAHIAKYNGVEPTRGKIRNCEYEFWAPQYVYYDAGKDFTDPGLALLRGNMETFSSASANYTGAVLGNAADYWTPKEEAQCQKLTDSAPITPVPSFVPGATEPSILPPL